MTTSSTGWPPRRLPPRSRLIRIRLARLRSTVFRRAGRAEARRRRTGPLRHAGVAVRLLVLLVQRLALCAAWLGATAAVFLAVDLRF